MDGKSKRKHHAFEKKGYREKRQRRERRERVRQNGK